MEKKVERILREFYSLEDVVNFNDLLLSLKDQEKRSRLYRTVIPEIIDCLSHRKPYQRPEEFVPNSESFKKILNDITLYESSQEKLKGFNHKMECVVSEYYPEYLNIFKHTYDELTYYDNYSYDPADSEPELVEYCFFTIKDSVTDQHKYITDFEDILISYIRKDKRYSGNDKDLVKDFIQQHRVVENQLLTYKLCDRLGIKFEEFDDTFGHYVEFENYDDFVSYDKKVKQSEVLAFIKEAKIHSETVRLVEDDKFIKYPIRQSCYFRILRDIETGRYKVYEEDIE